MVACRRQADPHHLPNRILKHPGAGSARRAISHCRRGCPRPRRDESCPREGSTVEDQPRNINSQISRSRTLQRTRRKRVMTNILVTYYSANGTTYKLAESIVAGAESTGAEVRLRRARELAPQAVIDSRPSWAAHLKETDHIEVPTHDDLRWADGIIIGTPTRYGNVATPISAFIESTGPLWFAGELSGKSGGGFV